MSGRHPLVTAAAMAGFGVLYLPLLAVAFFSVNNTKYGLVWRGFTWKWYIQLFQDRFIQEAAFNSLVLAVVSTVLATLIGTVLAIGLARFPWSKKTHAFFDFIIYLPVVVPDIILAAALVVAFGALRTIASIFDPGLINMIIGHVTFQIAFVALVVKSRLDTLGRDIEEAARDLYASSSYLLWHVTLPLLAPGIVAGAMLAFTLSLDDFVISFFTAGPKSDTLPLYIYAAVRKGVTPKIHALSTLIVLITVILVVGVERFTRKAEAEEE